MERGTTKYCDCHCHKLEKLKNKPPTLDFAHEVKERDDIKLLLNDIAHIIGATIKEKAPNMGFALLLFDFGEGGEFFYASNAHRADMIRMLQEAITKLGVHG